MAELIVRSGSGSGVVLVDQADVALVKQFSWGLWKIRNRRYAYARAGGRAILMHRLITDAPKGMHVDHINGDGTDNRRSNLRICTTKENVRNSGSRGGTSKFKGVRWMKNVNKWAAGIRVDGKSHHLGVFSIEEDAARAYDAAAAKHFGEFARLNFPV